MNLNIVTAASNSVGKSILKKIGNSQDITLGLSRRWCDIANVLNVQLIDLTDEEEVKKTLMTVLGSIDSNSIDTIRIFHNCCYAVAEVPDLDVNHPLLQQEPKLIDKLILQDNDGDGIDDRAYHSLLTTFDNVFTTVQYHYPNKKISVGTICSLIDKKKYIPTIFQSMVRSNKMLRGKIESLAMSNANIQAVCISASTVKTGTETNFRKFCKEQQYRTSWDTIADVLVSEMKEHKNLYKDIDVYTFNPRYNEYYKNETDEQMTERLKWEIGLI